MSKRSLAWHERQSRIAGSLLLLASLAAAANACDGAKDETTLQSGAGSGGGGSGGSSGSGGTSAGAGGVTEMKDASADATPDARYVDPCVLSSIEEYCRRRNDCPTLAEARFSLRTRPGYGPRVIVQRRCAAPDGAPRISVGAGNEVNWTKVFVYDAETQELLGVRVTDDTYGCEPAFYEEAFGSIPGYYGEKSPDCDFLVPPECGWPEEIGDIDAGVVDGGDAGPDLRNNECILAP